MPAWTELIDAIDRRPVGERLPWLSAALTQSFETIAHLRKRNLIVYASGFLQKPAAAPHLLQINSEDMNGLMAVMHGMDWSKGLTLMLHTPGGVINAAESVVAYLWSKFRHIEVVIPTFAMSAGTMISLAADRLIMGRQSQLGPIDPQMMVGGRMVSARAVVAQFESARADILENQATAHVWAPILSHLGPSLLTEARNSIEYGERMVADWLAQRMFRDESDPEALAKATARHFSDAGLHKSHGRRIDREEARRNHLAVSDLEDDQALQDAVLTAYHLLSIAFDRTPTTKLFASGTGQISVRQAHVPPEVAA